MGIKRAVQSELLLGPSDPPPLPWAFQLPSADSPYRQTPLLSLLSALPQLCYL